MKKFIFAALWLITFPGLCLSDQGKLPMSKNPEGIAVLDFKAEFESGITEELAYFQEKCGYKLETDFNISNLSQGTSAEDLRSVKSYCAMPLTELVTVCEKGEAYKAVVAKKIKKFSCRYLGDTAKRSLTLEDSTLTWSFEYVSELETGHSDFISKVLMELL